MSKAKRKRAGAKRSAFSVNERLSDQARAVLSANKRIDIIEQQMANDRASLQIFRDGAVRADDLLGVSINHIQSDIAQLRADQRSAVSFCERVAQERAPRRFTLRWYCIPWWGRVRA